MSFETINNQDPAVLLERMAWDQRLQFELAWRRFSQPGEEPTVKAFNQYFKTWVEHNGEEFSAKFREILRTQPDLESLYQTDPQAALVEIEQALYQAEPSGARPIIDKAA